VEQTVERVKKVTPTEWMRQRFKGLLDPLGTFFNRLGIMPNTMTIIGLAVNVVASVFLARGNMLVGGILVLLAGPLDALDGTMARLRNMPTDFGAFVDSVTDRYSELVIFGGLLYYTLRADDFLMSLAVFLAAAGSVLVSYIRARGQSLGMDTKIGILTRFERYIVLAPCLILSIPQVGLWTIAVLANITALQRILDVRRQARARSFEE
jgi:CDP-diacylglycerol--glycerol-3-phosphate 3-phosphatidyltransferase